MEKNSVFSIETREAVMKEVAEKYHALTELKDKRKKVMAEYSRLDDKIRKLDQTLKNACECFDIDFQADYDDEGNYDKKYFLEEE